MLEDASVPICAFFGRVDEILADRGQVLLVQALFGTKLGFTVSEATALALSQVFASLSLKPVLAKLSLDLALPLFRCALALRSFVLARRLVAMFVNMCMG